jgi:4-amino-4-deoxy-L-arabinose transferase-like glycosyltransferase
LSDGAARYRRVREAAARHHRGLLAVILLLGLATHLFRLDTPPVPLFDEGKFYLPAARAILAGGGDPNFEHPPLGKLALAGGIAVLGDNPWGWRLPAALAGGVGLWFTYLIAFRVWRSRAAALVAAGLLATDLLWLSFSRLAMLDVFLAVPLLAGIERGLAHRRSGRVRDLLAAGAAVGLAAAAKWSGLWVLPALALLLLLPETSRWSKLRAFALLGWAVAAGYALPWALYGAVAGQSPVHLIERHAAMLGYLATAGATPAGESANLLAPLRWLLNEPLVLTSGSDGSRWLALVSNPVVFWPGVVAAAALGWSTLRRWDAERGLLVLALLSLYLPWFALPRIKYFYYLLPVLPLLCVILGGALAAWLPPVGGRFEKTQQRRLALLAGYLALAAAVAAGGFPLVTGMWVR